MIVAPVLLATVAVVLALSVRVLVRFASAADLFDLAASIERGGESPDTDYLADFAKRNGVDRASEDCGDAFTRSRVTVSLAMVEAAAETAAAEAARQIALRSIEERLRCDPLDGNAWLRYAIMESRGEGRRLARVLDDLSMSYKTAPSEGWIVEPRLAFATELVLSGVAAFEMDYLDDLKRFAAFEPGNRVADAFVETSRPVRARLRAIIDKLPDERKRWIIAQIDALGVDYWEQ
ncbi:MAG: hypothetical protein JO234_13595 [Hyphomicrobiales bacterium]|nr:hypothetical protein [Hyphomicrobiales bacterium]